MYRGRRFWTQRGKDTKVGFQTEIASEWQNEPHSGPLALTIRFYFKDNRRRDIDSHLKCLLDAMTGIVYDDDSQVIELHVFKFIDKKQPRVAIEVLYSDEYDMH